MLFRISHKGSPAKWMVLVDGQHHGEYLDKEGAIITQSRRQKTRTNVAKPAEVWVEAARVY